MRRFAQLFRALDETNRTQEKVAVLEGYFSSAPARDAAWALYFLRGRKLPRAVNSTQLRAWAGAEAGLPPWLVEECCETVGDLAETIALLLPPGTASGEMALHELVENRLLLFPNLTEPARRALLRRTWSELNAIQRFLFNKLITGAFRVGVARTLVARALARLANVSPAVMAHRLMGDWQPLEADFLRLLAPSNPGTEAAQPYPFYLACPLDKPSQTLGPAVAWQAEWKWDGIRAQLLRRHDHTLLWSRGEELVTQTFPEIVRAGQLLPKGTVLDGEIVAWQGETPLPFGQLQRRLGRKNPGPAICREAPVCFMAFDLLEMDGTDLRPRPLHERRSNLEGIMIQVKTRFESGDPADAAPAVPRSLQPELFDPSIWSSASPSASAPAKPILALRLSPVLPLEEWDCLQHYQERARQHGVEGIMIKLRDSSYGVGRQRGAWWKWKVDPYHIDAVLVAAQPGHGRRAGLYTDYTFAVWDQDHLLPVAKAYSGLNDQEIRSVDAFVRQNTLERHGPVRSVKPELVFELAFEGIRPSSRHRAGLALRFPRIHRWRQDKTAREADTLESVRALLPISCSTQSPKALLDKPGEK